MFKIAHDKKNDILLVQRNFVIVLTLILLVIVFLLSICLVRKSTHMVLVPFGMHDRLDISYRRPQNNYLEAVTRDLVNTMLNLTPSNIDYAYKTVLLYANGTSYGGIKNQLDILKKNVINKKFSTSFYPIAIYPDNTTMTVVVEGILYTYFGQKEVSRDEKTYEIKYNYKAGRLSISGFSEIVKYKS